MGFFVDASLTPKLPIEEYVETFDSNGAVGIWPPEGIKTFDPLDVPFLNTLILLMSGTTCTWAHHAVREGHKDQAIQALWITVGLGIFFHLCKVETRSWVALFSLYVLSIRFLYGNWFPCFM